MKHRYIESIFFSFLACLLLNGCYILYSWSPSDISKKEWKKNYGEVDTINNVEIECEHYCFYDRIIYGEKDILHVHYLIGAKKDSVKYVRMRFYNNYADTLQYYDTEIDFGDTNKSATKIYLYKGVKKIKYLNLALRYSLKRGNNIDTITRIYTMKRWLLLRFRRND
ncbi:MAG TPA: hypothetical protein VNG53_10520 [Bacteroidia bacterium]|nr:hypothetical protein [Bacteroidia bacterium]